MDQWGKKKYVGKARVDGEKRSNGREKACVDERQVQSRDNLAPYALSSLFLLVVCVSFAFFVCF